jgi:hypothetical protein
MNWLSAQQKKEKEAQDNAAWERRHHTRKRPSLKQQVIVKTVQDRYLKAEFSWPRSVSTFPHVVLLCLSTHSSESAFSADIWRNEGGDGKRGRITPCGLDVRSSA